MTEIKKLIIKGGIQNQENHNQFQNSDFNSVEEHLIQLKVELLEEIDKRLVKALEKNKKR